MSIAQNNRFLRVVLAVAVLAAFTCAPTARGYTTCGPILSSETWDLAGSPYVLTCDVVVMPGATLTIDPGVTVIMNPNVRLRVQGGYLIALGTFGNDINFQSANPGNRGVGVNIAPNAATSATFEYCNFTQLQSGIQLECCATSQPNPPILIRVCNFFSNNTGISGYSGTSALVFACYFDGGGTGIGVDTADKQLVNCTFVNLAVAAQCMERSSFSNCSISSCTVGLDLCAGGYGHPVRDCAISGCGVGVRNPDVFERNNVSFNTTGVVLQFNALTIQCNDIYGNSLYDAEVVTGGNVNVPSNWWGTTNTSQIDANIKDGNDQGGLGLALYNPILTTNYSSTACLCVYPSISVHPVSATKYENQNVSFSITAAGSPPLTYQWYRNNVALNNGFRVSGAQTATLSITPLGWNGGDPAWTDTGVYHCRVTNPCYFSDSFPATLTVNNCWADYNHNGGVSPQDLFSFLGGYFAGCP